MSTLNITAREFKSLVSPVLPHASTDKQLPVLNSVRIETRGPWLVAMATDRFRLGVHRISRPEASTDEWSATVPLAAVKGIIGTFAPRRGLDADLTLTIDGGNLAAAADGAMVGGFFDASFRWRLEDGEFPPLDKLLSKALADTNFQPSTKVRFDFVGAFRAADPYGQGLWAKVTGTDDRVPLVITDGENFIGMVMPRRGGTEFPALDDWADILGGIATAAEPLPEAASA